MSPWENQCRLRRSRGWHWFSGGDNFPYHPLVQSVVIILYWMLIKYIVYISFGFKTIQVKWIFEFVFRTPLNPTLKPVKMYGEPYVHKFSTIDNFLNFTRRQAISPVVKFHHVMGRGFMIQRVILIFIKCLSANQNQLFYMRV